MSASGPMDGIPGIGGVFKGLTSSSLKNLLRAIAADPFAAVCFFGLLLLVPLFATMLFICMRRSANDVWHRSRQRVCTEEQREYWISRRRQRIVGMYGGYPSHMWKEDGMLRQAAKRKRTVVDAAGNVMKAVKKIRLNPKKHKNPWRPVFAPKAAEEEDVFAKLSGLEAQSDLGSRSLRGGSSSERLLPAGEGAWWTLLGRLPANRKSRTPRSSDAVRRKSRSSLATMESLMEMDEETELTQGEAAVWSPLLNEKGEDVRMMPREPTVWGPLPVNTGEKTSLPPQGLAFWDTLSQATAIVDPRPSSNPTVEHGAKEAREQRDRSDSPQFGQDVQRPQRSAEPKALVSSLRYGHSKQDTELAPLRFVTRPSLVGSRRPSSIGEEYF